MCGLLCFTMQAANSAEPLWVQYDQASDVVAKKGEYELSNRYLSGAINELEKTFPNGRPVNVDFHTQICLYSVIHHAADLFFRSQQEANNAMMKMPASIGDPDAIKKLLPWYDSIIAKEAIAIADHKKVTTISERILGKDNRFTISAKEDDRKFAELVEDFKKQKAQMEQLSKTLETSKTTHY
jgi:hypothetical protein